MREQKSMSLNLEKRRAERTALTHGELSRENERRAALGEEALDDAEEIKDRPDAILARGVRRSPPTWWRSRPRYLARAKSGELTTEARRAPGGHDCSVVLDYNTK